MHALKDIILVAHNNDLVKVISHDIVNNHASLLPDLRSITIFLPSQQTQNILINEIAKAAKENGYTAILPPQITTIKQWLRKGFNNKILLSQYARELILVDALKQQAELFSNANPWKIAHELLSLFDAMLLNDVKPTDFKKHYHGNNSELVHALIEESELVKILWDAWRDQINGEQYADPTEEYAKSLSTFQPNESSIFYCAELINLSVLERRFINTLNNNTLYFYAYASNIELSSRSDAWSSSHINENTSKSFVEPFISKPFSMLINQVYINDEASIKHRAETFSNTFPQDALDGKLKLYRSDQFDQHVKAIDIQIRLWIDKNIKKIGVVTTDRKLVRRLRAVLEHANVPANDAAGWALATTSAAVAVEWWLQLVEEHYPAKQLISLVNSPFFPIEDKQLHQQAITYLEKEIILKYNLHNGLANYRTFIDKARDSEKSQAHRADDSIFNYLSNVLDKIENSSLLLAKLFNYKSFPLHKFITELSNSLKPLGLYTNLKSDLAGEQIIKLLESQAAQFKLIDNKMNWSECRRFMSRVFDQQNFKPPTSLSIQQSTITFCSLEQSRLQKFDALVIASVDNKHFPSSNSNYVFFNENVRTEIGIPTWRDDRQRQLHQFRCLLDASDHILLTIQTLNNGETIQPSPWLEAIETFYTLAYDTNLIDHQLIAMVDQEITNVIHHSIIKLPIDTEQPKPLLIDELKPSKVSISQYQNLVNCPYQYFALSCLKLAPTDELQDELNNADFGSLVHQAIHAFFSKTQYYPGPFQHKVTAPNRSKAEDMLTSISEAVFKQEHVTHENNFNNYLWLQRWKRLIPSFIDWEINRQIEHTPREHELAISMPINTQFQAFGRLDRVDNNNSGDAIIDYKTGQTPSKKSVVNGEQVQLPMYALLNDSNASTSTTRAEYVVIGKNNTVKETAIIKDTELEELKKMHLDRLHAFFQSMNENLPFTALANEETCKRCDAFGICRKPFWNR